MSIRQTTEIRVRGTVQGVGFRPTVWRFAHDAGLVGEVLNDGFGVLIRITGNNDAIETFIHRLHHESPPLSHIEHLESCVLEQRIDFHEFRIVESVAGENRTRVSPDAATCAACRDEVRDVDERRYGYPFANCTHCGPRFSIVKQVPYDRANTTMADFLMCPACSDEYADPADRRFHAQPIACPVCGPALWLETNETSVADQSRISARTTIVPPAAIDLLKDGAILAIRGLGGFHLACDATSSAAVERLRERKHRYGKPFAVMAQDIEMVRRFCRVTASEADLLQSPEAPIVLLSVSGPDSLPDEIAPGLNIVGFMLPYTPLHQLIMEQVGRPLVMTSGNISDEPQITSLKGARQRLSSIVDGVLMHNRDIANRIDDSVARFMAGQVRLIRRARGYAPSAIPLPAGFDDAPDLLAYGGELKSTFCVVKNGAAILSQHQGDLEDVATFEDYQKNLQLYRAMYDHQPRLLVADLHPEYLSTKLARQDAAEAQLPVVEVQHHHAHVASCLAENGVPLKTRPVLGIALDGVGFGDDGTIWGGEFLLADYHDYQRLATFKPVAMPGGAQAIRQPWRNTYAHLVAGPGWEEFSRQCSGLDLYRHLLTKPLSTIDRMLKRKLNVPLASSCGRLFDAVAAAVGICADEALFEGHGAMELEAHAEHCLPSATDRPYPFSIAVDPTTELLIIEPESMWQALIADLAAGTAVTLMAARFHRGLALAIRDVVVSLRNANGVKSVFDTVALTGGCFQNRLLLEDLVELFAAEELGCLTHSKVPAGDGGLALGQAAIAAARQIGQVDQVKSHFHESTQLRNDVCASESLDRS